MDGNWVTAWSMAHCGCSLMAPRTAKKTIRTKVKANVSGSGIRLCFSNKMGGRPVGIKNVFVRIGEQKAIKLYFSGKSETIIAAGQDVISDAADITIHAQDDIRLSMYYPGHARPVSGNFTTLGEHSVKGDFSEAESFVTEPYKTYMSKISPVEIPELVTILKGVEIFTKQKVKVVAAFGDSITQMGKWVNPLIERLYKEQPGKLAFLNMGINGNRLLRDTGVKVFRHMYGFAGIKRIQWDLFKLSGLTTVLLELGGNDLLQPGSAGIFSAGKKELCTFDELVSGYRYILNECRQKGIRVIGCTVSPFGGFKTFSEKTDGLRRRFNRWILDCGEFDNTLDFASWLADPENTSFMAKDFDSGDHVHPNEKGGEFMAAQIDSALLV